MTTTLLIEEPADPAAEVPGLAEVLHAAVAAGASIGFVFPFTLADAAAFWSGLVPAFSTGSRRLLVARDEDGRTLGTVQLQLAMPDNGRHRAEILKLMVHPAARRRGIARTLMVRAETLARDERRSLLVLDTRVGDAAQPLYASLGFVLSGIVPDYALEVEGGRLDATAIMYKQLG